jgi:cation diffusion facilitator family transporter
VPHHDHDHEHRPVLDPPEEGHDHDHGQDHGHDHGHDHGPENANGNANRNGHGYGHDHGPQGHDHDDHDHEDEHGHDHDHEDDHGHEHGSHDGRDHDHGSHDGRDHDHVAHGHGDHGHDDDHEHDHDHDHDHGAHGLLGKLRHLFAPHSHDTADKIDAELETSRDGVRALWVSLAVLGFTAVLQAIVVLWSGSVALLGDTLHNVADALTAVPLGLAFLVGRRPPNRRYTYGFGRAEDLAGIIIVGFITASALTAGWAAIDRLRHPAPVSHLFAVAGAAVIGFLGNEAVAQLRIRVGRRIGSAALVADGLHARTDGFTSLAVLVGAGGVAIGWDWADPVVGLLITVAILLVLRQAALEVYRRLMDAVDPSTVDAVEATLRGTPGVLDVGSVRLRWIGHKLRAECDIVVDDQLSIVEAHAIAVAAEHRLIHDVPRLTAALVHADPVAPEGADHHEVLADHRDPAS